MKSNKHYIQLFIACLCFYEATVSPTPVTRLDTLKDPITNFTVSLFKIAKPDEGKGGNKFMSPFSVMAALMLTLLGTDGNTERELMSALRMTGIQTDNIHQDFKHLQDYLNKSLNNDITLAIANRIFPKLGVELKHQYKSDAERYYGSEIEALDFAKRAEESRKYINDWASVKTNNLIKDVLPKGSITPDSIMFLVNAIYFKATWDLQFNKDKTETREFYITSTNTERVEMMNMVTDKVRSGISSEFNCKVLELSYKGGKFNMLFILPTTTDGLAVLESRVTTDALRSISSSLMQQKTVVSIPKFEMVSSFSNLKDSLKTLGINDLFGNADFSRMFKDPSGLFVDKVIHKAFVKVDEEGAEAAAVTVVKITKSASIKPPPFVFNANHPFLFLIREKDTGAILFMGRYVKKQN